MRPVVRSLLYDAAVLILAGVVVRRTTGPVEVAAYVVAFTTLASAPFDAWRASRLSRG